MKRHYRVKYTDPQGVVHYGIVDSFSDEAKKQAKKGVCLVEDAVLPQTTPVPESELTDIAMGMGRYPDDGFDKYVVAAYKEAVKRSDALKTFGVNAHFAVGVADGSAHYVVTEVKGSRCKVEWRGFCPDRWTDHHFGWGGWFPTSSVKRYWRKASDKLFGNSLFDMG